MASWCGGCPLLCCALGLVATRQYRFQGTKCEPPHTQVGDFRLFRRVLASLPPKTVFWRQLAGITRNRGASVTQRGQKMKIQILDSRPISEEIWLDRRSVFKSAGLVAIGAMLPTFAVREADAV